MLVLTCVVEALIMITSRTAVQYTRFTDIRVEASDNARFERQIEEHAVAIN